LHGHNGLIEITIRANKLNSLGMVMDFEEIKLKVQSWVDRELDHKMILNQKDPLIQDLRKHGQPFLAIRGNPTAEALAKLIYDYAKSRKLPVAQVKLWETRSSFASYGN
jgi:6-pyruvoyltetrahydropterin/6-carboxytetrahydropterin synthase